MTTQFCEEVNKKACGKAMLTPYNDGALLSPVKIAAGAATGIADIGFSTALIQKGSSL